jgi:hypothetical protein
MSEFGITQLLKVNRVPPFIEEWNLRLKQCRSLQGPEEHFWDAMVECFDVIPERRPSASMACATIATVIVDFSR